MGGLLDGEGAALGSDDEPHLVRLNQERQIGPGLLPNIEGLDEFLR
jgi:hypothetical protein